MCCPRRAVRETASASPVLVVSPFSVGLPLGRLLSSPVGSIPNGPTKDFRRRGTGSRAPLVNRCFAVLYETRLYRVRREPALSLLGVPSPRARGGVHHVHVLAARCDLETGKSLNIAPPGWQKTFGSGARRLQPRARLEPARRPGPRQDAATRPSRPLVQRVEHGIVPLSRTAAGIRVDVHSVVEDSLAPK